MMQQQSLRQAARASVLFLFLLLAGAFLYYRERLVFDATYISFRIIYTGALCIQVERYGSFITQMVPLIAAKLHLPLKALLIAYTVSFNLFYAIAGLWLYRAGRYSLVILMALYFCLYVSDTYFWTNNELHQGICWMFLMFGYIYSARAEGRKQSWHHKPVVYYPLLTILAVMAIYTHPIVMVPFAFLWGAIIIEHREGGWRRQELIIHSLLFVSIIIFKSQTSSRNSYDGNLLAKLNGKNLADVFAAFQSDMADLFWKGCLHNYWLLLLLFLAGILVMVRLRKWLMLAWSTAVCLGFFVLLCLIFDKGGALFYIESEFMPLAIPGCFAFVCYILPRIRPQVAIVCMVFIFSVRAYYITAAATKFTKRWHSLQELVLYMKANNLHKLIIPRNEQLEQKLIQSWALPMESLYASMLLDGVSRSVILMDDARRQEFAAKTNIMIEPFGFYELQDLHRHGYFRFDSTEAYQVVDYEIISGKVRKQ